MGRWYFYSGLHGNTSFMYSVGFHVCFFCILFAFILWFVWKKWILLLSIYFHCLTVLVSGLVILANPVRGVSLCALLLDKG